MDETRLRSILWELIGLGVSLQIKDGRADFLVPLKWPRRSPAERAVRANLGTLRAAEADVARLWADVAANGPGVRVCGRCAALVYRPEEARDHPWAFCESLLCPFRSDPRSRTAKFWAAKKAADEDRTNAEPVPD